MQLRGGLLSWCIKASFFVALGGALVQVWAMINFGSMSAGLLYLRGVRVHLVDKSKSFGTVEAGTESAAGPRVDVALPVPEQPRGGLTQRAKPMSKNSDNSSSLMAEALALCVMRYILDS